MDWRKSLQSLGILIFILSSSVEVSGGTMPQPLTQQNSQQQMSLIFLTTEEKGLPRERGATARVPRCLKRPFDIPPLIALVPPNSIVKTVAANPTLYVYIPELRGVHSAELVIVDEPDREIYKRMFTLPGTSGIYKLTVTETLALETDKNYRWYFAVACEPQDRSSDLIVEGLLRRSELSPEFKTLLEQAKNPLEQARFYAGARFWNETLNIAVPLRREYPEEWEELLRSVKLEKYSQKPFVECCKAE
ncbi:MAG TPA: DUF928 domain-containing protein [Coleofasciculaceae cyanobacterium]